MSKATLEKLFGSKARVKILKLFFRNTDKIFELKEIAFRIQEKPKIVKQEIKRLISAGLLKATRIISQ